jgi:hypothetical protein
MNSATDGQHRSNWKSGLGRKATESRYLGAAAQIIPKILDLQETAPDQAPTARRDHEPCSTDHPAPSGARRQSHPLCSGRRSEAGLFPKTMDFVPSCKQSDDIKNAVFTAGGFPMALIMAGLASIPPASRADQVDPITTLGIN